MALTVGTSSGAAFVQPFTLVGGAQSATHFDVLLRCSHVNPANPNIRVERVNLVAIRSGLVDQAVLP